MQRLLQWSHGWRIYIKRTNDKCTNVDKCTESRSSFPSVLFYFKSANFRRSLPLKESGMDAMTSSFKMGKIELIHEAKRWANCLFFAPHRTLPVQNHGRGVDWVAAPAFSSSQHRRWRSAQEAPWRAGAHTCLLLVVLQARSPSGREEPSVEGITDGVWLSCGVPRPPLLHHTSGEGTGGLQCGC